MFLRSTFVFASVFCVASLAYGQNVPASTSPSPSQSPSQSTTPQPAVVPPTQVTVTLDPDLVAQAIKKVLTPEAPPPKPETYIVDDKVSGELSQALKIEPGKLFLTAGTVLVKSQKLPVLLSGLNPADNSVSVESLEVTKSVWIDVTIAFELKKGTKLSSGSSFLSLSKPTYVPIPKADIVLPSAHRMPGNTKALSDEATLIETLALQDQQRKAAEAALALQEAQKKEAAAIAELKVKQEAAARALKAEQDATATALQKIREDLAKIKTDGAAAMSAATRAQGHADAADRSAQAAERHALAAANAKTDAETAATNAKTAKDEAVTAAAEAQRLLDEVKAERAKPATTVSQAAPAAAPVTYTATTGQTYTQPSSCSMSWDPRRRQWVRTCQ